MILLTNDDGIFSEGIRALREAIVTKEKAIVVNRLLSELFNKIDIILVDFKIEFGRFNSGKKVEIILADEISPDSCRLWDIKSNEKLDKDRFRRNLGGLIEAYKEVATRLEIDLSNF